MKKLITLATLAIIATASSAQAATSGSVQQGDSPVGIHNPSAMMATDQNVTKVNGQYEVNKKDFDLVISFCYDHMDKPGAINIDIPEIPDFEYEISPIQYNSDGGSATVSVHYMGNANGPVLWDPMISIEDANPEDGISIIDTVFLVSVNIFPNSEYEALQEGNDYYESQRDDVDGGANGSEDASSTNGMDDSAPTHYQGQTGGAGVPNVEDSSSVDTSASSDKPKESTKQETKPTVKHLDTEAEERHNIPNIFKGVILVVLIGAVVGTIGICVERHIRRKKGKHNSK